MADKMAAAQGKVTAFIGLTKESLDDTSDSLDGDSEIKRRLIDWRNMMTMLSWTASARQLLLQGYGCISSVYVSFQVLQHTAFRRMPASMLGFLVRIYYKLDDNILISCNFPTQFLWTLQQLRLHLCCRLIQCSVVALFADQKPVITTSPVGT